jgi:transposase InsO family protein
LVSDHGAQFTTEAFRVSLKTRGIRQRFGAIGKTGSIAIVERRWSTLKEALGRGCLKPLTRQDLERRLKMASLLRASAFPPSAHGRHSGAAALGAVC